MNNPKLRALLLEGISPSATELLESRGFSVEEFPKSLTESELIERIAGVHLLGIRSKTKVTAKVLEAARDLLAIGCFGVGTNQVPLETAASYGVPVFNAPFSNTRSVAELTLGCMLMLARFGGDLNTLMHAGRWKKSAKGSIELRGKTLGLLGYGHIGQQIGLLAESIGMQIVFYDLQKKLPLGRAQQLSSPGEVLKSADFVSLHMPALKTNHALISDPELAQMRSGSYLLNLSRGTLVDLPALRRAIESGHLAGAALDVYPQEPQTNDEAFECVLAGIPNVILTPHIGGSTEQAQHSIGIEVATAFVDFAEAGSTVGAVNFPSVNLPLSKSPCRLLSTHRNVPGVISEISRIISEANLNIDSQLLGTAKDVGYLVMDLHQSIPADALQQITSLPFSIRTRMLCVDGRAE